MDESQVGERFVLCNNQRGTAVVLNPSGSYMWTLLAQPQTAASLAAHLCDAYPVDGAQAESDVAEYLTELESEGVIERDE